MKKFLAAPPTHFVLLGALLFAWQSVREDAPSRVPADPARYQIVVEPTTMEELRNNYRKATGREPSPKDEKALVRDYADREILYREARSRGLDQADRSVKWRLVQKMQFLEGRENDDPDDLYKEALALGLDRDDLVIRRLLIEKMRLLIKLGAVREAPSEQTLVEFYETNAEDYRQPARVSLRHVFLSSDKRGETMHGDAEQLLETLRDSSATPKEAVALGDVFALGHHLRSSSERNLAKLLGPDFAKASIDLEAGKWHGPIRSAYGTHLVWVEDRTESSLPGLEPVRNQVLQRYLAERREIAMREELERMRKEYAVSVREEGAAQG